MRKLVLITFLLLTTAALNAFGAVEYALKSGRSFSEGRVLKNGLKVFWWNIGCSSSKGLKKIDKKIRDEFNPKNQFYNLKKLSKSDEFTPDVVVLGEYCPKYFSKETIKILKKEYPYSFHVKKSNDQFKIRNGLIVFSKLKIKVLRQDVLESGDFLEKKYMMSCYEKYKDDFLKNSFDPKFWTRPLIELEVVKNNKPYKLVPVHLANPWRMVHKCLGNSRISTGIEIVDGTNNPNYSQSLQLTKEYSGASSTVLIGDFNAARSLKGFVSKSYKTLSKSFGASVIKSDEFTFFDERSGFGSYSLDHAFVSDDLAVKKEMVLPFSGSDHLPLYIVVE